eukprot:CAMPEP_0113533788 /NCGR_PEP_ID=MMETSP0015_2-20120614/4803_1 /TAXON_ID=2838 /ORGANISM="Odontella" /LENGTH=645 /DNA_ID=CAMNT_0000432887 /DNA_START=210 /DNA_END=2147 /DNA_ORIENTATION=+ /assembly_acc=CAM_ASM_000160
MTASLSTMPMPNNGEGNGGGNGIGSIGGTAARSAPVIRHNHIDNALADERELEDRAEPGRGDEAKGGGPGTGGRKKGRRKLSEVPIAEVLKAKHTLRWVEPVITKDATVREAVSVCIERGLSGMMVVDKSDRISEATRERGRVVGMTTSRDLLRVMAAGFKEGKTADDLMDVRIGEFMTPISQVIYARPEETIGMCRTVMAKLGVKCLPVLSNGRVEGLVTARDMSEFGLEATERGGKKNYLRHVSERVGLSSNTSMAEPPAYLRTHLAMESRAHYVNVGVGEMPHPFKTADAGCGMNRRDFGPKDYSTDPDLSEDAHFVSRVEVPDEVGAEFRFVTYMGVADGVGSWREYGVDPRDFSHKLMEECKNILKETSATARGNYETNERYRRLIMPKDILSKAYDRVKADNVIGSSTACVGLFDCKSHQLHFANLGDSGIVVLRHIDSDNARRALKRRSGTANVKSGSNKSELRVAFVSQQQLRSFNHPYQLGWTGEELDQEEEGHSFKNPTESCTTSIHVRRGDIILMATDGLFDNVDIDDIAQVAMKWEQDNGFVRGGDVSAREKRWSMGNSMSLLSSEAVPELAATLCEKARELSLDNSVDSPFAVLAKENDIMWSGGMPDDCTVVAMHVVGKLSDDTVGQVPAS